MGKNAVTPSAIDVDNTPWTQQQASFPGNNSALLLLVGIDGKIQVANPAARRILDRDVVGLEIEEVLPSADSPAWQDCNTGESVQFEQNLGAATYQFTVLAQVHEKVFYLYGTEITELKQTENALREEQATISAILGHTSSVVYVKDVSGRYRFINRRYEQLFNITDQEIQGKTDHDLFPKEIADAFLENDLRVLKTGQTIDLEEAVPQDDGLHYYISTKFPLFDSAGKISGVCGMSTDITDRKRAEDALIKSEEQMRIMTDATHDAVVMIDETGATTFWNSAAERIFGYGSHEIIGRDLLEKIFPIEVAESRAVDIRSFCSADDGHRQGRTMELRARHKDGSELPVELSLSATRVGTKWHAVGVARDISERVRREEEYAQTVSQYMAMINTVPAQTFLKDINGKYVLANTAFCSWAGATPLDIIGKTDAQLSASYDVILRQDLESQVMAEDRTISLQDSRSVDSDGRERWTSTTIVPLHDQQGLVNGLVGLIQDVTELHRSREQLVQADKMAAIGTLSAGVAHEINNPVGFISSNLNTMGKYLKKIRRFTQTDSKPDADDREAITEMLDDFADAIDESREGAERVRKIVADLKSFSRIDKSQEEFYDLNKGLETTLNIVWNELKYKCTVDKHYGDIPALYCIPNQLNQVFMNMLVNAGHAIQGNSGRITITTSSDKDNIYVSISDTGMGIPRDNLKRIFEPFYTTKDVGKGTGLGLSMAYDIVQKHSGRIDITSEPESGAEFVITLPLKGLSSSETQNPDG